MKQEQKNHVSADALIQLLKGAKSIRWQLALGVVMSLVLVVCALVIPTQMGALVQILIDYFDAPETGASVLAQLAPGLLALLGVYLLRAAVSYGKMQLLNRAVSRYFTCNLRIQISDKIQRLPVSFVDHTPVGDILSRMTEDVSRIGGSLHTVLDTITGGFLQILAIAVVMFLQNWQLSLAVIAFMPVSIWLSAKIAGRSETYFHQMFKQSGELYSVVEEAYTNYATTKAYNLEEHCAERHARINDARRVPMSKTLSIIDTGELIDLIGQLRIVLPHTVVQAQAILDERKKILGEAKEEAKASTGKADAYYTEKVENAKRFEQDVKMEADAYDKQIRQKAQEDSSAIVADANTRAEQIIFNAQQQSQKLVEDNEITRRAQAYAVETRERAEKDADSIYNQACVQVDKMLSGAAAALSRSASELAALRDNLLTQGSAQQQDR